MKKILLSALGLVFMTSGCMQSDNMRYANTIEISDTDSIQNIIDKAAHVVPTPNQWNALKNEFIAFIHFGPNTFTRKEWGNGMEDPKVFDLKTLDTDQWCEAMKDAGMKMVIFTAKHHDGFVLWQSRYTKHGIMSTNFRNGKGDVLKDLSESCKKYGLKLGIYLSPADLYQIESPDGLYGNLSQYTKRTIPREVSGRPFENKTKFEFVVDDYNEYFLNQLFELLTEYGPIHEVWFDGAHPKRKGGQTYKYSAWKELIHTLAPEAVIFGKEDVRWCGNEAGFTRDTEWNVVTYDQNPDTMSYFQDMTDIDLGSRKVLAKGKYLHYQQAETNTSIRDGWFYRDDEHQKVRSTDNIFDIYERSVGGNSTFLLNIPPNREGRFSQTDVQVLKETGERIRQTYGNNLLDGAKGPKALLDDNENTYLDVNEPIEISTPAPITINRLLLQEAVNKRSERVEEHAVDAWVDGQWKEIVHSTNIGYKRILRFPNVTTNKIRIRILSSRATPAISHISAHMYTARPPRLTCTQDINGMVSIEAIKNGFHWNDNEKDLNNGVKIYYTTDGTEPDEGSILYTGPFAMNGGKLKAVSIRNEQKGAVLEEQMGIAKNKWKGLNDNTKNDGHGVFKALDANPSTFWMSADKSQNFIALNLGEEENLSGFAYTPQVKNPKGMMAKGNILISNDGKTWNKVEAFEFGNLINDPSKRYHFFGQNIKTKYIKIEATETADNSEVATAAEIDFF